jgi:lysophospholipase L1-like esterase
MKTGLPLGLAFRKKRGAVAPPPMPLRVIGANEQINSGGEGRTGRNRQASRQQYIIGQAASDLVFAANNWFMGSSTDSANATSITIEEAALESAGGVVVPILFGGGRSITLSSGQNNVQSDPIPSSAFSLPSFARDSVWWVKAIVSVPAAGNQVLYAQSLIGDVTGQQCLWYDSAALTLDADVAGTFPTANTEGRSNGFRMIMLGHPVVDGRSFITIGDSISVGTGDGTANGAIGRGMTQRAMASSGANCFPNLSFGKSGATIAAFTSTTRWQAYIAYARHAIDEIGTNNVGASNASTMQTSIASLWSILRSGGIQKIIRTELLVRTTSTDNYATTANQTPNAGWANGGTTVQMNTWFASKLADTTINYYVSGLRAAVADGTATDRWAIPKTYNADDVHPNNAGYVLLSGTYLRPVLEHVGLA